MTDAVAGGGRQAAPGAALVAAALFVFTDGPPFFASLHMFGRAEPS